MVGFRKIIFSTFLISACSLQSCMQTIEKEQNPIVENFTVLNSNVKIYVNGLKESFKIHFISDSHITIEDERGKNFYDYTKRMGGDAVEPENYGKTNGREKTFMASLEKAKQENADLVILGGDIINFPSLASVEYIKNIMDDSKLNWVYTAGNHDWHYEGEPGKSSNHHDKWVNSNLLPLYQGENPMYRSQIIKGINFITLDNSDFEVSEEQVEFLKEQIKKELPIVLSIHIPIYQIGHNVDYGCGHPDLDSDHDIYYEIERREPWPKEGLKEITFQFRNLVINSPEIFAILAGHTHEECVDFFNGKIQFVADANYQGKDICLEFFPNN